jgi:secreted PhoX family phosphatase
MDPTGTGIQPRLSKVGNAGRGNGGYGPLSNDQGVLLLPHGFQLRVFGAIGDLMSDGHVTPIAHDGMAAFAAPNDRVRLVRNHEDRNGPTAAIAPNPYDRVAGGGTTTLEVDPGRNLVRDFVSLSGTAVNCAGGPTPWGSWLTAEETVVGPREDFEETHGWVFEVPASANAPVAAIPLKALGRFSHEAVALDPRTGIVYETEDNAFPPGSGFYRFIPDRPGVLPVGGRLQMAVVRGTPRADLRCSASAIPVGTSFSIGWVDIDFVDPGDADGETTRRAALFMNGFDKGGAIFDRLEGCWFGEGSVFFQDTRGGAVREGTVWQYTPAAREGHGGPDDCGTLRLIYESPGANVLDNPDNITVSPRGGLVLCEDGGGVQYMRGLTRAGEIFDLAVNQVNDAEFAGATFSPDGNTLYVNIQGETRGQATDPGVRGSGMTIAIWGPWSTGAL